MLFLHGIEFGSGLWLGMFLCTAVFLAIVGFLEWLLCRERSFYPVQRKASPKRSSLGPRDLLSMSPAEFERLYGDGFDEDAFGRKKPPIRATFCTVVAWEDRPRHAKRRQRANDYTDDRIG